MTQLEQLVVNGIAVETEPVGAELSIEDREEFRHEYSRICRLTLNKKERLSGLLQQAIQADDKNRLVIQEEIDNIMQELVTLSETLGRIAGILNDSPEGLPDPS